ncbi:conserved hypothetical protein [Stutzerimonas xanthomarina]|nr:conserved hypothetical protein [Stutzerimonas xanthomarina]
MVAPSQRDIEAIDHFSPVGILEDFLAQESRLGWRPERRIGQINVFGQGRVGFDKAPDRDIIVGQAQLLEQVMEGVDRLFHVEPPVLTRG